MTNTTYNIDTLSVSEEAKEVLRRTVRVASSKNPAISVFHLLRTCDFILSIHDRKGTDFFIKVIDTNVNHAVLPHLTHYHFDK